jgi:hypothetical protein
MIKDAFNLYLLLDNNVRSYIDKSNVQSQILRKERITILLMDCE